jgi:hypothetical protein
MEYNTETDPTSIMIIPLKSSGDISIKYRINLKQLKLSIWEYDYEFPILSDQDLDETK